MFIRKLTQKKDDRVYTYLKLVENVWQKGAVSLFLSVKRDSSVEMISPQPNWLDITVATLVKC